MKNSSYQDFHNKLWEYYESHGRHELLWRQSDQDNTFDPYKIMVSEIMLQQTQVARVTLKYQEFLRKFPDVSSLANAPLGDVLRIWQGLGYNRRAKFLWQAAAQVVDTYQGTMPRTTEELVKLAGVGVNTAGAISVYAYNKPAIFIETNIRTVYIHHFFPDQQNVSDHEIKDVLTQTIDIENPRIFYWALMDYGSYLKQSHGNLSRASKSYKKQSSFHGSRRQIRGMVIRELTKGSQSYVELADIVQDERLDTVLSDLQAEGLVVKHADNYSI